MKQIWLVRHAQSKSQTGEDTDVLNPELSQVGKVQAKRLIEPLKGLKIDYVLISPFKRAWQTYKLSQVQAKKVEFDSRLIESDWGIPNYYQPILPLATPDIAMPDGNDAFFKPVEVRATELLTYLLAQEEEKFMLFGHWGIFSHLLLAFVDLAHSQTVEATMDNAAISFLEVDDDQNRYIRYWNYRAHVAELL